MAKSKATAESTGKKVPGWRITVQGQFRTLDPNTGLRGKRFFKDESFDFPEFVSYRAGFKEEKYTTEDGRLIKNVKPDIQRAHIKRVGLHIIQRYYIDERLKEKYPEFTSVRECKIFSKEPIEIEESSFTALNPKNIASMSESELLMFVAMNDLNISLTEFHDLGDKKLAVQDAFQTKLAEDKAAGRLKPKSVEEENLTDPDLMDDPLAAFQ